MFISKKKEPLMRVELMTPSLPRMYSTTELQRLFFLAKKRTFPFGEIRCAKIHFFLILHPTPNFFLFLFQLIDNQRQTILPVGDVHPQGALDFAQIEAR